MSSIVFCILAVILSAYIIAFPFKFRAARPTVCVNERLLRKNPSLSASKIATKENNGPALDHKATNNDLLAYFGEVVPDFDRDRVYVSDIKKVLNWYNILQKANYIANLTAPAVTTTGTVTINNSESVEEAVVVEATEEKPKAKRAPKKKTEDKE